MKPLPIMLAASLLVSTGAWAQGSGAANPDPGMSKAPPAAGTPVDKGAVVTPPKTGTEDAVITPPRNVDPAIDDATEGVDARNRQQTDKKKSTRRDRGDAQTGQRQSR